MDDYYKMLNVSQTASYNDILRAVGTLKKSAKMDKSIDTNFTSQALFVLNKRNRMYYDAMLKANEVIMDMCQYDIILECLGIYAELTKVYFELIAIQSNPLALDRYCEKKEIKELELKLGELLNKLVALGEEQGPLLPINSKDPQLTK